MGQYRHELENAIGLRHINKDTLRDFAPWMDDKGKSYHNEQVSYFDDQILNLLPLVLDEMMEELTRRFDLKVENMATPALQEIDRQIKSLGK